MPNHIRQIVYPGYRTILMSSESLFTFSMLSATYVATSCPIFVCYRQHMSPYLVLSLCAIGDICRHIMSYPCVLLATYVTTCPIPVCYRRHMSPYLVLSLCAISNICCHSFISLNFAGLFSIDAMISTQLSMMSCVENGL